MLRAGRIDALYENPGVFENWVDRSRQNFSDFQSAGAPQQTAQELFVAFGPKVKEAKLYAKWLGEETQAMQKDGRLQALKKKYKLNF